MGAGIEFGSMAQHGDGYAKHRAKAEEDERNTKAAEAVASAQETAERNKALTPPDLTGETMQKALAAGRLRARSGMGRKGTFLTTTAAQESQAIGQKLYTAEKAKEAAAKEQKRREKVRDEHALQGIGIKYG